MGIFTEGALGFRLVLEQTRKGVGWEDSLCAVALANAIKRFDAQCFPASPDDVIIKVACDTGIVATWIPTLSTRGEYEIFAEGLARGLFNIADQHGFGRDVLSTNRAIAVVAVHEVRHRIQHRCPDVRRHLWRQATASDLERRAYLVMRETSRRGERDRNEFDACCIETTVAELIRAQRNESDIIDLLLGETS